MSGEVKRVLFFSKSAGFEHGPIHREGGALSPAEQLLVAFGRKHGFGVDCTKDGSVFTPMRLEDYDLFLFCTTGNLLEAGADGQPPMPAGGKQVLLDAIAGGKGFVGVHNASDTFHGEGEGVDPFIAMLGGEFRTHGSQQNATQELTSPSFPGLEDLPASFETFDEWYCQRNLASDLHVILLQHTDGMTGEMYEGQPAYPSAWARNHGAGRVFYTSMGHNIENWEAEVFLKVLLAGLNWAAGRTEADLTPNIAAVAPGVPTV
jgi:hypothetical protein